MPDALILSALYLLVFHNRPDRWGIKRLKKSFNKKGKKKDIGPTQHRPDKCLDDPIDPSPFTFPYTKVTPSLYPISLLL